MHKIRRNIKQFWQQLKTIQWSKKDHVDGWIAVDMKFLCRYFRRHQDTIKYNLLKLLEFGLVRLAKFKGLYIKFVEDKMVFKEDVVMGKYYQKVQLIKQGCNMLFDALNKIREDNGLTRLQKCPPEYFGCFKELIREYVKNYDNIQEELKPIIDAMNYFYSYYPEVCRQFNIRSKIPDFRYFYQHRNVIIDFIMSGQK